MKRFDSFHLHSALCHAMPHHTIPLRSDFMEMVFVFQFLPLALTVTVAVIVTGGAPYYLFSHFK